MKRAVVCAAMLACAGSARADCRADATALRARLETDARHARQWNLAWEIAFGAAAAGSFTLAAARVNPVGTFDDDFRDTQYVGAAKSAIGVLGHVVFPLRIEVPAVASEPCADRDALRLALAEAARRERASFWLNHVGGIVVNAAGAIVLAERRSWQVGAASALVGYPVALLSVYTQPRAAWHAWRSWTIQASATAAGGALWVSGEF